MRSEIDRAAERIAASDRVVVLTGAGISAESGIATFRDPGGLWSRFDPLEVASAGGWMRFLISKPWEAIEFLRALADGFRDAAPNAGHLALAELERLGHVRAVVTQNVDGLHQEAGSSSVIELHGTFTRRRCTTCGAREAITRDEFVAELEEIAIKLSTYMVSHPAHILHRCACGGLSRWDFVAFGEPVHDAERAFAEAQACDVMLVCGTSGEVFPACELPAEAKRHGAFVVEVNPASTDLTSLADARLERAAGEALPDLLAAVVRASRTRQEEVWRPSPAASG